MERFSGYIGIPFLPFGRTRDGCDCWGLVRLIYADVFGISLPSYHDGYKSCEDDDGITNLISDQAGGWNTVIAGDERIGDVIVLRMRGVPMHVGFVVAPGFMIHVHDGVETVIENYRRSSWTSRVTGFFRHSELL